MVVGFPTVGYTEFNQTVYNRIKSLNCTRLDSFEKYNKSPKRFISWNFSIPNTDYSNVYMCHKSGRKYYTLQQLNNQSIEIW